jgi:hypothetical protein
MLLHNKLWAGRDCVSASKQDLFSALPPELRTMIFDMLLVFPGCEVIDGASNSGQLCIRPRSDITTAKLHDNECMSFDGDTTYNAYILRANLLAPLQVNKQFYNEATPIFYAKNAFADDNIRALYDSLRRMAPERRNCIRHLICAYVSSHSAEKLVATRCFKLMKDMYSLRSLSISLYERGQEFARSLGYIPEWIEDPLKTRGIHTLSKLRIEEVKIFGDCPKLRAFLAQMVKPKGKEAPKKPVKKRKPKKLTAGVDEGTATSGLIVAQP